MSKKTKEINQSITKRQLSLIDAGIKKISLLVEDSEEFRKSIAIAVIELKLEVFGGKGFDFSGYEESFLLRRVSSAIGFTTCSLKNWISVFNGLETKKVAASVTCYNDLTFTDKLAVVREIRQNKKKPTEAIKEFYSDKNDPVKRKIFYLERYVNTGLATARGLEELNVKLTKSQIDIIDSLTIKLKVLSKILSSLKEG